ARPAFAGNGDVLDVEPSEARLDAGLAVATIGGDGPRCPTEERRDALDRRDEEWGVGRVAPEHGQVEHDAVAVVGHLRLVAELDRLAEPAPGDRTGGGG